MPGRGWSKPLSGFADEVEKTQNRRLRAAALQALSGVIERSPVDTGAFRGNNRVSVGNPDTSIDMMAEDGGGQQTLAEGAGVIAAVRAPYAVIYIQNNLPYAERLEQGYSSQAPGGMYAITFNNLREASGRDF